MTGTSRKTSILIAAGIALALVAWMLSGIGTTPESAGDELTVGRDSVEGGERPMRVLVVRSAARTIPSIVELSARTEPNRRVELRAETDGRVVELGADRGARIESGAPIATLDMRDRAARLTEAEALIEQSQLQYEAALELKDQEFVSDTQIAEARARVASAEAARERILLDIDRTGIAAPFNGMLQERYVELGDYVQSGDRIAEFVDTDPIIVVADVSEKQVAGLSRGGTGRTEIAGKPYSGTIRYLAPVAASETRTFRIELAVPNPGNEIRAGMTARLTIESGQIRAHTLSPALLTLADDGTIGVKTVDEFDRVRFYPVTIEGATDDGVTITGLPDVASVISVGQGFVVEGQAVVPVQNEADLSRTDNERPY